MSDELRKLLAEVLQATTEEIWTELSEQSARLSAQRFLLEVMYANAFREDPDGFTALMAQLIEKTRTSPVTSSPTPAEVLIELQARTATHLQRFENAVSLRIEQG